MSKLAHLVGLGMIAPLVLCGTARADGQAAPPAGAAPAQVVVTAPSGSTVTSPTPVAVTAPSGSTVMSSTPVVVTTPQGSTFTSTSPVVVTVPAGSTVTEVPVPGLVKIHIQTKELVTLEHRANPDAPWQVGCETPCDARLPAADEYRVVGVGIAESGPFSLTTPKGSEVKIHVAPGIKSKAKIGEVLTFTGAVMVVGALVVGIGAADPGSVFNASGQTDNYNWNVIAIGTTVAVAGIATGVLGGAWWYDNSHTRVAGDIQEGSDQPVRGGLEPRYQTGMRLTSGGPQTYSAPIFSASF